MRKVIGTLIALALVIGFVPNALHAKYKKEYKLSVVVGPKGPWGEAATRFVQLVKEKTHGRVNIKPYFSGQLFAGKQTNEFLLLKSGVADFALGSTINWSTTVKSLNLFSLPFFFAAGDKGYAQVDAVTHGKPGKMIFEQLDKLGVVGLGWGENGFREITNSKHPIKTPEDLKGLKIRVVGSPIFIDIYRALGANPTSMNWGEAVTAFRQGVVDGQENPINVVIIPYKVYEFHKYITIWHYLIDPLIMGVNKKVWNSFTPEDQKAIREAAEIALAEEVAKARCGLVGGNLMAIEYLKSKGMQVTILNDQERAAFKAKTKKVYKKWVPVIGRDLVKAAEEAISKVQ